jgi:hypothetical protein
LGDAEVGRVNGREAIKWTVVESRALDVKKCRELLPAESIEQLETIRTSRRFSLVDETE